MEWVVGLGCIGELRRVCGERLPVRCLSWEWELGRYVRDDIGAYIFMILYVRTIN